MRAAHLLLTSALALGAFASCVLDRTGGLVRDDGTGGAGLDDPPPVGGGGNPPSVGGAGTGTPPGTGGAAPGVGDCVIQPPELCDDCNVDPGDGCDGQGQIEPGWVCPIPGELCRHVSGVLLADGRDTPKSGAQNATPIFDDTCPPGMVLVGIEATDSGDWPGGDEFLSFVAPHCAAPTVDAAGRYRWSASTVGTIHGGVDDCCVNNTTAYPPLLCPDDAFVVGYRAWESSYVTQISLACRGMVFDGSAAAIDTTTTTVGPMGSGDGQEGGVELCPAGTLATSLTGSAGAVLDLIGLGCGTPSHTVCGDGTTQGVEACDDGNATSGDGCSALCAQER